MDLETTEHEASRPSASSLLSVLHCPQPAAISRNRKASLNSSPCGKRQSAASGKFENAISIDTVQRITVIIVQVHDSIINPRRTCTGGLQ